MGAEFADRVLAACREGAEEAAAALGRGLEGAFTLSPPETIDRLDPQSPPAAWRGPGLILSVAGKDGTAAFLLPAAEGLLPEWSAHPDESGRSRLRTLAQELGAVLLPEEFAPEQFDARWENDLAAAAVGLCGSEETSLALLPVSSGDHKGALSLVWPVAGPQADAADSEAPAAETAEAIPPAREPTHAEAAPPAAENPAPKPHDRIIYERIEEALPYLPVYSRSLLKIKVPVRVTLASTRLPVRQIVDLAPGSLIQFQKSFDEALELEVGRQRVAQGEAVKVGEKFGLRITAMSLPGERFGAVAPKRSGQA